MDGIFVKKTRDGRRKRLEIQRLRSNGSNDSLSSYGANGTTTTTASAAAATTDYAFFKKTKKTGLRNKVVPSCDLNVNDLNKKLSSSEEEEESTVEITVSGGVGDGVEICAGEELPRLRCASHGCVSVCGRRREMEDAVTMVPEFLSGGFDFFGVYDGHGGARVAHECRDRLHGLLAKELESSNGGDGGGGVNDGDHKMLVVEEKIDWEKVMVSCFLKMDEEVSGNRGGGTEVVEDMKSIGSTAVVALVGREKIIVANCGDSRAVMARGGVAVPLSRDHRPDRSDEMERVEAAGGRVINWNGYRVLGVLATSRSIGDHYLKPYVISVPEVTVTQRTESDEFLVLASDGLWDVMSNEQVCDVVRRCLQGRIVRRSLKSSGASRSGIPCTNAAEAAAVLTELAMARGSRDNVSVVVIELNKTKVVSS